MDINDKIKKYLNEGKINNPLEEHNILEKLDGIYYSKTGIKPYTQKSAIIVWDVFEQFIGDDLVNKIQIMIKEHDFLFHIIKKRYSESVFYQQSTILFIYWMLKKHKRRLIEDWPFPKEILESLASDIGVNIWDE